MSVPNLGGDESGRRPTRPNRATVRFRWRLRREPPRGSPGADIVAEIDQSPASLRSFVFTSVRQLLAGPAFRGAVPGYLPPDEEGRIALLRTKLDGIASLSLAGEKESQP